MRMTHIMIHPAWHFFSAQIPKGYSTEVVLMGYAHHPAVEGVAETSATSDRVSDRKSVLAYLLEALQVSRRLQAARAMHHYRHLLPKDRADTTGE
jgi:hypothetical protein